MSPMRHCEEEFTSMNDIEPGANALFLAARDLAGGAGEGRAG